MYEKHNRYDSSIVFDGYKNGFSDQYWSGSSIRTVLFGSTTWQIRRSPANDNSMMASDVVTLVASVKS